jgi:CubicO group peptidase (beta-lactamase class C family)
MRGTSGSAWACGFLFALLAACGAEVSDQQAPSTENGDDPGHDAGTADARTPVDDSGSPADAIADGPREAATDAQKPPALDPTLFDPCAKGLAGDPIFTWANPEPSRVDVDALHRLVADAASQKSDSLIVAIDDTIIAHKCFVAPSDLAPSVQSITKSVMSLAIGALLDDGKIASVDEPLSDFFPEWTDGDRAKVTIRHLLTHSSGVVDAIGDNGAAVLFTVDDALAYARTQQPALTPGTTFNYSNTGIMLLGGAATIAAGMDIATFVDQRFFAPMGIVDAGWSRDKAGHAMTPGGLFMQAMDVLRLARLGRAQGSWQGKSLVSASWIAQSTAPQSVVPYPCYGYLWWMLRENCAADVGPTGVPGPLHGFFADGYGGNYAVVVPSSHVLGVRLKIQESPDPGVALATDFDALPGELAALTP